MQYGLRTDAPRAPVAQGPGIVDVIESACHLAVLMGTKAAPVKRGPGRPPGAGGEVADAISILVRQCEESGLLERYRRQLGEMP